MNTITSLAEIPKSREKCKSECTDPSEHYGDPSDWLKGDEWDTVMNYDALWSRYMVPDRNGKA